MTSPLLTVNSTILCPHGGTASLSTANSKAKAEGSRTRCAGR